MSDAAREIPIQEVVAQLHALGITAGDVLLVHTSFRAVRPVEGGPIGLIEALSRCIGSEGTLVMPSWTGDDDQPFNHETTPAAADLGIVAGLFWQCPGVQRGRHAFAFAAGGPLAADILADDLVLPPHQPNSPIGRVLDHDGRVLLLGVEHDANTTVHLAELVAGVPYRKRNHITVMRDGKPMRIDYLENDHCCELFKLTDGWLKQTGLQSEGLVGHAPSKLMRSRAVVNTVVPHLRRDPFTFLHPRDAGCAECDEAWQSLAHSTG